MLSLASQSIPKDQPIRSSNTPSSDKNVSNAFFCSYHPGFYSCCYSNRPRQCEGPVHSYKTLFDSVVNPNQAILPYTGNFSAFLAHTPIPLIGSMIAFNETSDDKTPQQLICTQELDEITENRFEEIGELSSQAINQLGLGSYAARYRDTVKINIDFLGS
jgi:hypothetical protein